jgi:hypothetical protein
MSTRRAVIRGSLVVAFALFAGNLVAQDKPADASGKWKWSFARPDGQTVESVLTAKQDGKKLTGASVLSTGEKHEIANGKVEGNTVSFEITRERQGQKVTAKYSGKLEGDSIKGKIESPAGGETRSFDWEAKRVKE